MAYYVTRIITTPSRTNKLPTSLLMPLTGVKSNHNMTCLLVEWLHAQKELISLKALVYLARDSRSMFQPITERICYRPHQSGARRPNLAFESHCFPALLNHFFSFRSCVIKINAVIYWFGCFCFSCSVVL